MTRQKAQDERESYNAFCDGKMIQSLSGGEWVDDPTPIFTQTGVHRIKSEPKRVQLGPQDVNLHRDLFQWQGDDATFTAHTVNKSCIYFHRDQIGTLWSDAMNNAKISHDYGATWGPCSKEAMMPEGGAK